MSAHVLVQERAEHYKQTNIWFVIGPGSHAIISKHCLLNLTKCKNPADSLVYGTTGFGSTQTFKSCAPNKCSVN